MLTTVFIRLLNLSISAGWIVLAVVLMRFILKKSPKWVNCVWWTIVAIRLSFPFSIKSVFSLMPSEEVVSPNIIYSAEPSVSTGIPAMNSIINPVISATLTPDITSSVNPLQILTSVASVIWICGAVIMLTYALVCYVKLKAKMRTAIRLEGDIYESENVSSPFILGFIKPKIYLPFNTQQPHRQHIIAHENAHIKRKDHFIKPFAFLLLSFYWFNPLMWVAYVLLCRDIELACDEKVISKLKDEERRGYSLALLQNSISGRMITACPLAFGEVGVKQRIKSVMNYKKPAFWIVIIAVLSCVFAAVCFLTNPVKESTIQKGYYKTETWIYHERATEGTPLNTYYINGENELMIAGSEVDGAIKETKITARELKGYAKMPEAWLAEYNFGEIEEAYTVCAYDEPTAGPVYIILKTESDDVLLATILEDTSDETSTVKLFSLQKLRLDKEENNIVLTKEEKLNRAITEALMANAPVYFGKQPMFTAESFSILAIHEELKETDPYTRLVTGETVAILFHRNSYNYENGQLIENINSNTAVISFEIDEGDNYTLREFSEFKKDELDSVYAKTFHLMVDEDSYDSEEYGNSLTYDCREKAMEHFGIANWVYSPMLSATFHYASPITFSLDYDKAVLSCSNGTMVKEKYREGNEYNAELTYENGENPVWCPSLPNDSNIKGATEAEITFRLYKKGRTVCKGKMTVRAQNNFTTQLGTMYIFELAETDEKVIMQNSDSGPVIRLSNNSNEIVYYKLPTSALDYYRTEIAHRYLENSQIEKLDEITEKAKWKYVEFTDIKNLTVDGEFRLSDGKTYYFSNEHNIVYHDHYMASLTDEEMRFIMTQQISRTYKSVIDGSMIATLCLHYDIPFFDFSPHPLSSTMYYGKYEETDRKIILEDEESGEKFVFKKSGGKLIFDKNNSSFLPQYEGVGNLKDGAVFIQ